MPPIAKRLVESQKAFENFVSQHNIEKNLETDGSTTYLVPIREFEHYDSLNRARISFGQAFALTPRSLLVSLVSCYDAFLGELLRAIFYLKPEMLNGSNRTFTFKELVEYGDLNQARENLIEKEIESLIRKNHSEHFDWMEEKFKIPLRKGLSIWSQFIELT